VIAAFFVLNPAGFGWASNSSNLKPLTEGASGSINLRSFAKGIRAMSIRNLLALAALIAALVVLVGWQRWSTVIRLLAIAGALWAAAQTAAEAKKIAA
jgi:hypothetical protein